MLVFVDANVLLYTRDRTADAKREKATRWLNELGKRGLLIVNLQVLNEVCHAALRKFRHLDAAAIREWVDELGFLGLSPIDVDVVEVAWQIRQTYRFSWFDCLIVASAETLGCSHLLTEDMGAPRRVGSLLLVDPFLADPGDLLSTS